MNHRANQTRCVPLAAMVRMCDYARVNRTLRVRPELPQGDDRGFFERCPDRRCREPDAALVPVFTRARRLEDLDRICVRLCEPLHAIRSHRAKSSCGQPALKRRPYNATRSFADDSGCRIGERELLRGHGPEVALQLHDPFGRCRNHCRAAANEEPNPRVVAKLRVRRYDDARILEC